MIILKLFHFVKEVKKKTSYRLHFYFLIPSFFFLHLPLNVNWKNISELMRMACLLFHKVSLISLLHSLAFLFYLFPFTVNDESGGAFIFF